MEIPFLLKGRSEFSSLIILSAKIISLMSKLLILNFFGANSKWFEETPWSDFLSTSNARLPESGKHSFLKCSQVNYHRL